MTPTQDIIAVMAGHTVDIALAHFEKAAHCQFSSRELRLIRGAFISAQIGVAREVAQLGANERAEIRSMDDAEVIAFIQAWLNREVTPT